MENSILTIPLSKKQEVRLLEMSKAMLNMYRYHFFYFGTVDMYNRTNKVINIHWFELCMTHLAERILNPKNEINSSVKKKLTDFFLETSAYSWFIQDPGMRESFADHPVDYLYKEFKKLKK